MATKQPTLLQNVQIDGVWYGPNYPNNEVTAEVREKITNPAAFEAAVVGNPLNTSLAGGVGGVATVGDDEDDDASAKHRAILEKEAEKQAKAAGKAGSADASDGRGSTGSEE